MSYIHVCCLKTWLNTYREAKETSISYSYFWKELSCDLCKQPFPDFLIHNHKRITFLDYNVPEGSPYLILEGTSKGHKNSRILHVLKLGV